MLARTSRTNTGEKVKVKVKKISSGKSKRKSFKLIKRKNGKVQIKTLGKKMRIKVVYLAPANKGYTKFHEIAKYVVR